MSSPECESTWDDDGIDITLAVDGMATTIGLVPETVEGLISALTEAIADREQAIEGKMQ